MHQLLLQAAPEYTAFCHLLYVRLYRRSTLLLDRNDIAILVLVTIVLVACASYSNWKVSAIGLTLDIVGVLLLWHFGLPSRLKPGGKVHTVWDEKIDDVEKKKFDFAKVAGDVAIWLIVLGFVFQFIGSV